MGESIQKAAQEAFVAIWDAQKERLHRLCTRWMTGDQEAARDAVAQVALSAMEELARSNTPISNYPAWLTRLARNACIDMHRERQARYRMCNDRGSDVIEELQTPQSPETENLRRELGRRIQRAIEKLPPRLLAAVELRFIEDAAYDDIASQLELSHDAVRKRIQDARDILYAELGPYLYNGHRPMTNGTERVALRKATVAPNEARLRSNRSRAL